MTASHSCKSARHARHECASATEDGGGARHQSHLRTEADLDKLYAQVKAEKGVVDIVVASAGFAGGAPIFDLSEAHYNKTMDINVKGVVFTVQKALPLMTRGGSIIVVSSVLNVKGTPNLGIYGATKAGVRPLVRTWAQELEDKA
jgi:NAD(P)-dependent dehydrogenase (short-subunit alcohol dehydrogenase family)